MTAKTKLFRFAGQEEKSTRRGGPRIRRDKLDRHNRFTAHALRETMVDVVKPKLNMPTEDALRVLASRLERLREDYWRHQYTDPLETQIASSAESLLSSLKELRHMYGVLENRYLAQKVEAIDRAREAVSRLFAESIAVEHIGRLPWHHLANVLPSDFETAIQTTNPGYKLGVGHEGPLARFIAAVAPRLTGEHPTPLSVTAELKKFKKKFLTGKQFGDRIPLPLTGEHPTPGFATELKEFQKRYLKGKEFGTRIPTP